ncbi:hypothetical protein L3X38_032641 [Prunus dulcis]|uniref:Uncharacterized protein n=1 Tax=Prunus dulcis TaxID=3755 RepID=A0AAD4VFU9_PRUDU|nr:hypothetical protein L3X38_032641 [Prunus dulcis]
MGSSSVSGKFQGGSCQLESCQLAELEQEVAVRYGGRILHLHLHHPLLHHLYLRLHHLHLPEIRLWI